MSDQADAVRTVDVDGSPMEVFEFHPEGAPTAGLVLAQHIPFGHTGLENDPFTLATARRYADSGFAVAAPFLFHWWPKEAEIETKRAEARDTAMVEDVGAALRVLREVPGMARRPVGIVGHCWGGRVAWLGACHYSEFEACVVFYGGRIRLAMGPGPAPIGLAARMRCRVAGFFGNDDRNPTPEDVDAYEVALRDAGIDYRFERYDGAGHGFQDATNPKRHHPEYSEDAWSKALRFLQETLGSNAL